MKSPDRRALLLTLAGVLVLVAAGVAGFFQVLSKRPVPIAAAAVPASWEQYRTSAGHEQHVGKSSIACKDCHDAERAGFTNPGVTVCGRCHEKESTHSHAGGMAKTDCLTCHTFAPGAAVGCIDCHREEQGKLASVVQHSSANCRNCHHPHETPAIQSAKCEACHDERATEHAAHSESKGCLDCHRAHAPAAAALQQCSTCHEKPAGPKPAGHDGCVTCHKPHDFVAAGARVCAGCHGAKPTLVSAIVETHANCTSCHTPHAPTEAASSCRRCHGDVTAEHGGKEACVDCHRPHGGDRTTIAKACTSCHNAIAASDNGAHAGGQPCTSCHKPHHFPPPAAEARGALCANCHGSETRLVAVNRGHQDCVSCHGASAHRPETPPACAKCHAKEASSAPAGHSQCEACHQPHSGERVDRGTACTNCHENKSSVLHGSIPSGCTSCHRAHGPDGVPAPPPCATCHERSTLPALHAVPSHGNCATCHTSHAPPRADRATCTTGCHANRKDHQVAAQLCTGCHVFGR